MTPQNPILIGNSLLNHRLRIILARNTRIPANPQQWPETISEREAVPDSFYAGREDEAPCLVPFPDHLLLDADSDNLPQARVRDALARWLEEASKEAGQRLARQYFCAVLFSPESATRLAQHLAQLGLQYVPRSHTARLFRYQDPRVMQRVWPLHIASLMSVKMMKTVQGLPVPQVEAKLTRYLVSLGLTTLGRTAAQYAGTLSQANRDRLRNAERGLSNAANRADAFKAAPNARAAALAGLLDVSFAIIKGTQFQTKMDARTGAELVGNILQGIGSLADWRAKAYEETVFKGVEGRNLFATPGMQATFDELQALQLKGLRLTAFKFLLPAALISAFFDGIDAWTSGQRGNYAVMAAQIASVAGTVFTVVSTGVAVFAIGNASLLAVAAVLGLIGAVLTVVAVIAVLLLKEDDWITWLRDNPLSLKRKGKKPIHNNLGDTLQKLANAQSGI